MAFHCHSTALSSIISETKRDTGRKARFFHTPPAFYAPLKGSPSEYCSNVFTENQNGVATLRWKKTRICLFASTQYTNVTDRQTDREADTARQHRPRLHSIARQKRRVSSYHILSNCSVQLCCWCSIICNSLFGERKRRYPSRAAIVTT